MIAAFYDSSSHQDCGFMLLAASNEAAIRHYSVGPKFISRACRNNRHRWPAVRLSQHVNLVLRLTLNSWRPFKSQIACEKKKKKKNYCFLTKHQNMVQPVDWRMSFKYFVACCGAKPGTWSRKGPSLHMYKINQTAWCKLLKVKVLHRNMLWSVSVCLCWDCKHKEKESVF